MESKWPEKLEIEEDEFDNYSKGKYFSDKAFFEVIAAGKYFEEEIITSVNVKANSENGTKPCVAPTENGTKPCVVPTGCTNRKADRVEIAKDMAESLPNGENSTKKSA